MDELKGLWCGKRINNKERNGEWVEGFLYPVKYTGFDFSGGTDYYIDTCPTGAGRQHTQVDPSTLGECTGLRDKNGKPIFEGDIVKHKDDDFEIKYSDEQARFLAVLANGVLNPVAIKNCEIIGNIHDNPEMIGGDSG